MEIISRTPVYGFTAGRSTTAAAAAPGVQYRRELYQKAGVKHCRRAAGVMHKTLHKPSVARSTPVHDAVQDWRETNVMPYYALVCFYDGYCEVTGVYDCKDDNDEDYTPEELLEFVLEADKSEGLETKAVYRLTAAGIPWYWTPETGMVRTDIEVK